MSVKKRKRNKLYTVEDFDNFLYSVGLKRLGLYKDASTKVKIQCLLDGHTWNVSFKELKNRNKKHGTNGCSVCAGNIKLTNNDIDKILKDKNKLILRNENYKNSSVKMNWMCMDNNCPIVKLTGKNHTWNACWNSINSCDSGCPECYEELRKQQGIESRYRHEEIVSMLKDRPTKIISPYQGMDVEVNWQCDDCDHIWSSKPRNIIHCGTDCPECNTTGNPLMTNEMIVEKLKLKDRTDVILWGEYKGSNIDTEWKCIAKGHIFPASPHAVTDHGTGCPLCRNKTETHVRDLILQHIKYDFFQHHKDYYVGDRRIEVDFYLIVKGNEVVIEYQGEGHYMPINWGQGMDRAKLDFEDQKIRDQIGRNICKDNGIILLEIPYWLSEEEKIAELLKINALNNIEISNVSKI